jgi:hypothetical protein
MKFALSAADWSLLRKLKVGQDDDSIQGKAFTEGSRWKNWKQE